jgi:hypothetical protein
MEPRRSTMGSPLTALLIDCVTPVLPVSTRGGRYWPAALLEEGWERRGLVCLGPKHRRKTGQACNLRTRYPRESRIDGSNGQTTYSPDRSWGVTCQNGKWQSPKFCN